MGKEPSFPGLRRPPAAAAAAFMGATPEEPVAEEKAPVVRAIEPARPRGKAKSSADSKATRRVSFYVSATNAQRLRMMAAEQDRDMSEIVDELFTRHLKSGSGT